MIDTDYLTLSLGTFRRTSSTTAERTSRSVYIENCVRRRGGQDSGLADRIEISVHETKPGEERWKDEPEKIGAMSTERIGLFLPSDSFAAFWEAAAATDGAWRQLALEYEGDPRQIAASITNATLVEFISDDTAGDFDEKLGRVRPRQNPVVAELRSIRDDVRGAVSRLIWVAIAVLIVIAASGTFRRWLG